MSGRVEGKTAIALPSPSIATRACNGSGQPLSLGPLRVSPAEKPPLGPCTAASAKFGEIESAATLQTTIALPAALIATSGAVASSPAGETVAGEEKEPPAGR